MSTNENQQPLNFPPEKAIVLADNEQDGTTYKCPDCGFTGTLDDFDICGLDDDKDDFFCPACHKVLGAKP